MENKLVLDNANTIADNIDGFSLEPLLETVSSIFQGLFLAVKVTIILALSFVYTILAVPAVLLYMVFYEHLIAKLIKKVRQEKRKAPYYYKWKKHHLDLYWEA